MKPLGACVVPSNVAPICDPSAPLGSRRRAECLGVSCDTAGSVPMFSPQEKEEIIVSVVDFLLETTDERVKFERAPFDHPEVFVRRRDFDARAGLPPPGFNCSPATGPISHYCR